VILCRRFAARIFLSSLFLWQTVLILVQMLPGSNLKSSPYFNTAHASRAFFAAMAITARQ
jgi:hypothetical protein